MSDYEISLKELPNEILVKLLYSISYVAMDRFGFDYSRLKKDETYQSRHSSNLSINYYSLGNKSYCVHDSTAFSFLLSPLSTPLLVIKIGITFTSKKNISTFMSFSLKYFI